MKKILLTLLILLLCVSAAGAQQPAQTTADSKDEEPRYEMMVYYLCLIYKGPKWSAEATPEREKIQSEHMANIRALAKSGKLILAGPFEEDGELRGLFLFKVDSLAEAKALADNDPAVKAGRLRCEIHPWFSAKGIKVELPGEKK
jgi:uncharacterized protein